MVLLGQQMHDNFAEALDDVVVCVMSRADVHRFLLSDPRISIRISEILGRRVAELERRLTDTVFKNVPQRIAATLCLLAGEQQKRPLGRGVQLALTHEQIAALTGTSRENRHQGPRRVHRPRPAQARTRQSHHPRPRRHHSRGGRVAPRRVGHDGADCAVNQNADDSGPSVAQRDRVWSAATLGSSSPATVRASAPVVAMPTTLKSGSVARMALSPSRTTG